MGKYLGWYTVVQVTSDGALIVPVRRVHQEHPGRGVRAFTAEKNRLSRSIKYI